MVPRDLVPAAVQNGRRGPHIFPGVPAGTYVAFEDLPFPGADFNYDDESFEFTNVRAASSTVPKPGSLALLGLGLAGLGSLRTRAKRLASGC